MTGDEPTRNLRGGNVSDRVVRDGDDREVSGDRTVEPDLRDALTMPSSDETAPVIAGAIGRFVVQGMLGEGGMGVVLSALDPELDRKVAIKLLRPDAVGKDGRARLVREARAMAKLSHPNVVAVYDVGDLGAQPFVAMELIDGEDLRSWLAARPRGWREILAMFMAAGRGLEAAHAAGIVHRDVKPGNILVGRDGRARVGDFGLVGIEDGTIAGTPAYMAPEQARGEAVDARSDQYALCVALDEALAGKGAPGWVTSAVARGRSKDPALRFLTMTELLAALGRDPAPRRRAMLAIVGALAIGGTLVFALTRGGGHVADPCAGTDARLVGVWDRARQDAVHAAFVATGAPFAEDTWRRLGERLDDYTGAWVDMTRDACRANRIDGRQSDSMMDARMQCLDRRLDAVKAIGDVWIGGVTVQELGRADAAVAALDPLGPCADTQTLAEAMPWPADPTKRVQITSLQTRVDLALADIAMGRVREAQEATRALRTEADATGWPAIQAQAAFAQGRALQAADDAAAQQPLTEAVRYAEQAHDDRTAARALLALVDSYANDSPNVDRALMTAQLAEGEIARAGGGDDLRVALLLSRASAEDTAARYDDAQRDAEEGLRVTTTANGAGSVAAVEALHLLEVIAEDRGDNALAPVLASVVLVATAAQLGTSHPAYADRLHSLGNVLEGAGSYAASARAYRAALEVKARVFGDDSADYALTLSNLADVEYYQGDVDGAIRDDRRAIAIRERKLGPDNPLLATTIGNLGNLLQHQGKLDEAEQMMERALSIKLKAYGELDHRVANSYENLGRLKEARHDLDGALADTMHALDIRTKKLGPDHPDTYGTLIRIGELDGARGHWDDARVQLQRAVDGLARVAPGTIDHGAALGDLGQAELELHDAEHAAAHLQAAIDVYEKGDLDLGMRGSMRAMRANALWQAGHHADAIEVAKIAEKELTEAGDDADLKDLRAWRKSHAL